MRACVSPPQLNTSHMVHVAANIAQDASTAFPPFVKIMAPAVAAIGLPVMAIQFLPCKGGFCLPPGRALNDCAKALKQNELATNRNRYFFMEEIGYVVKYN